jgi:hypothetical protein
MKFFNFGNVSTFFFSSFSSLPFLLSLSSFLLPHAGAPRINEQRRPSQQGSSPIWCSSPWRPTCSSSSMDSRARCPSPSPPGELMVGHGKPQPSSIFSWDNQNGCAQSSSCYPQPQFYLKLTLISEFCGILFLQTSSDFISNSNFNPSRLLPHPYISLGAPPLCMPMPISPQNQTLAATQAPPLSSVPLIAVISIPNLSYQIKPRVGLCA